MDFIKRKERQDVCHLGDTWRKMGFSQALEEVWNGLRIGEKHFRRSE